MLIKSRRTSKTSYLPPQIFIPYPLSVKHVFNPSVLLPSRTCCTFWPQYIAGIHINLCQMLQQRLIWLFWCIHPTHVHASQRLIFFFFFWDQSRGREGPIPRGCWRLFFSRWSGPRRKLARLGMGWHRKWLPEPRKGFRPILFPVKHPEERSSSTLETKPTAGETESTTGLTMHFIYLHTQQHLIVFAQITKKLIFSFTSNGI